MNKSDSDLKKAIDELDLDPIKFKIMNEDEGLGWTANQVDEAEKFYKRFLFLSAKYPEKPLVPTKHIDVIWHQHILDTQKYFTDCMSIFGEFMHHFPYFGERGNEDAKEWQKATSETYELYEQHFKESVHKLAGFFNKNSVDDVSAVCAACTPSPPPSCGGACGDIARIPQPQLRPSLPNNALNTSLAWY